MSYSLYDFDKYFEMSEIELENHLIGPLILYIKKLENEKEVLEKTVVKLKKNYNQLCKEYTKSIMKDSMIEKNQIQNKTLSKPSNKVENPRKQILSKSV